MPETGWYVELATIDPLPEGWAQVTMWVRRGDEVEPEQYVGPIVADSDDQVTLEVAYEHVAFDKAAWRVRYSGHRESSVVKTGVALGMALLTVALLLTFLAPVSGLNVCVTFAALVPFAISLAAHRLATLNKSESHA